jgi:hypothetical protein
MNGLMIAAQIKAGKRAHNDILSAPLVKTPYIMEGFTIIDCPTAEDQANVALTCMGLGNDKIQMAVVDEHYLLRVETLPTFVFEMLKDDNVPMYCPDGQHPSILCPVAFSHPASDLGITYVPTNTIALFQEDGSFLTITRPLWEGLYNILDVDVNVNHESFEGTEPTSKFTSKVLFERGVKRPNVNAMVFKSSNVWYVEKIMERINTLQDIHLVEIDTDEDTYYILEMDPKILDPVGRLERLQLFEGDIDMTLPKDVILLSRHILEGLYIPHGMTIEPKLPRDILSNIYKTKGFVSTYIFPVKGKLVVHTVSKNDFQPLSSYRFSLTCKDQKSFDKIKASFKGEYTEFVS